MEPDISRKEKVDLVKILDFIFVPGSFIRTKQEFDERGERSSDLMYIPCMIAEATRLFCYCNLSYMR